MATKIKDGIDEFLIMLLDIENGNLCALKVELQRLEVAHRHLTGHIFDLVIEQPRKSTRKLRKINRRILIIKKLCLDLLAAYDPFCDFLIGRMEEKTKHRALIILIIVDKMHLALNFIKKVKEIPEDFGYCQLM